MTTDIYLQMLDTFNDTLEKISEDKEEALKSKGRSCFMTACQKAVVNFDKFKDSVVKLHRPQEIPKSCDALYMHSENEWFLIEFKNGKISKQVIYEVRGKIFESLLLLTEKLNKTIGFTRKNMNFILVYNTIFWREDIEQSLFKREYEKRLLCLQKLYLKRVSIWNTTEFDNEFVKKYGL